MQPLRAQPTDKDKGPKESMVLPAMVVADVLKEGKNLARSMHQEGPLARSGAINSIDKAKELAENPKPMPKFPMAEQYQQHEAKLEIKASPQTVTRTHPTMQKDMLKKMPKKLKKSPRAERTPTR